MAIRMEIALPSGHTVLIDACDAALVAPYRWYAERRGQQIYARGRMPGHRKWGPYMHNLIVGPPVGMVTDHRDGCGLNNRRENLRACSQAANVINAGKKRANKRFKGVFFSGARQAWWAQIAVGGKREFLGYHDTEDAAARAYDGAAARVHGEFAKLNFPVEQDGPLTLGWL